ncbi:class I adenylate-forming enzyme family protein [Branchiibius sp. NY16-3462-2]|uniref:class I adenylate-forming enzyme family protein n=1 Tax=Branchiibius sp. NY16-3462-2 TaxID=1807500 RepID=UPI0025BC2238|nr:AMP-binding protein [Branchiibius sp. NY16-3462-2]
MDSSFDLAQQATTVSDRLVDLPSSRAHEDPSGPCLVDGQRRWDNATFAAAVTQLAARFAALGVGPGDTVAVMLPNRIEIVTAMFAAWWRGAALTPINPALTDAEVLFQLEDSSSRVLVGDQRSTGLAERLGIASIDVDTMDEHPVAADDLGEHLSPALDEFALIIYTSGTTGRPKGCVLDHANIEAMVNSIRQHLSLTADDRSLLVLPLFHCNGLLVGVLSPLLAGGSVIISPRFDPATFWDLVEEEKPTYFSAVPTMYALIDARTTRAVDSSSLRFVICGAAPMPTELISRFEERFDVTVVEGYGLSECSVAATINPIEGIRKAGTVGLALPGVEIQIEPADGHIAAPGERGEVLIKGDIVMRGYLGRPEETAKVLADGWLHTGDVGYLDDDGYLTLVDRMKDLIIRGGENIYPKEVESVLYEHPAVLEAAVVGRPDSTYGEVPVAFVALRPGTSVTAAELEEHCSAVLARFKVPREINFAASLPKNSVGKLMKSQLL